MPLLPDMSSLHPIERHWIKANLVAGLVSLAASLVIYALRQVTGAAAADASSTAVMMQYGAAVLLCGLAGAVDGVLTGAALQRIIPQLPSGAWIVLRSLMAVLGGLVNERTLSIPSGDPGDPMPLFARIVMGAAFGAALGAAAGSLEAFVMRKAALGTVAWIEWSAIGYAVAVGLVGAAVVYTSSLTGISDELVNQVFGLALTLIIALMLIPALRQLQPRRGV